ncbi:MAG: hypothetical protein H6638_12600 [Ardenticatenales bacterium]|nr:hypothetical protein [Ardenticatenales bacterium]
MHARQRTTTAGRPYTVAAWFVGARKGRAAVPDRGPPCPTAGRRARPRAAIARPRGNRDVPPCPHRVTITVHARQRTSSTAGRPTVTLVWQVPVRVRAAVMPDAEPAMPTREPRAPGRVGPPCPTAAWAAMPDRVERRARPWAAVPDIDVKIAKHPTAWGRAPRHRVTIAVRARGGNRRLTAGRPYTVAMVYGCP